MSKNRIKLYMTARLKEPSTWRGIVLLLTAAGVPLAPAMSEALIVLGLALAGGIGVLTPERAK